MTKKIGTNSGNSGQKRRPDLLVRSRLILSLIGYGYSRIDILNAINKQWLVSKQLLTEDLQRMVRNGWIVDLNPDVNKYKNYALQESGRTVLAGYEKSDSARLTKLENVRHKCLIENPLYLKRLLSVESYGFEANRNFKNSVSYHGKINGLTVQVIMGKIPSMIITPRPLYISSARKSRPKVQQTVLDLVTELNERWMLKLTSPIALSGHGQVAMGGKLPRLLLEKNGGGSIRTQRKYGTVHVDASPPDKYPHFEMPFDAPAEIDELLDLPDDLKKIIQRVEKMELNENERYQVMQRMANVIEKNSETSQKLFDLISGQVKAGQGISRPENEASVEIPLNSLTRSIYG